MTASIRIPIYGCLDDERIRRSTASRIGRKPALAYSPIDRITIFFICALEFTDNGYGFGFAWGDYDSDGDLDIYLPNSGMRGYCKLFRNEVGDDNHWFKVDLVGVISNADGIGARVHLFIGGNEQIREVTGAGSALPGRRMTRPCFVSSPRNDSPEDIQLTSVYPPYDVSVMARVTERAWRRTASDGIGPSFENREFSR
jgi:hypothetical protein